MKNYFKICSMLFKYMFKRGGEKSSKWIFLAYGVLGVTFAILLISVCFGVSVMSVAFRDLGLVAELITLLLAIGCVIVVVFGLIPMINYLYFSKDTEFMMTLPVSPSTIYFAKITVVYLTEAIVSVLFLVPCMLTVGVTLNLGGIFFIVSIISTLLVPAIPLVVVSIVAIPMMYIVSFFKKKGALSSVVLILLFAGLMVGYLFLMEGINGALPEGETVDFTAIVTKFSNGLKSTCKILLPLYAVARLAVGSNNTLFGDFSVPVASLINFVSFVVVVAVLVLIAFLVSALVYRRGVRSMLENAKGKSSGNATFTKSSSAFWALVKKEWRELFRTPAFAFQCLSGIIMCPIMLVFIMVTSETGFAVGGDLRSSLLISFILIAMIGMVGMSMNIGAATTITREGKNFYLMKTIPVDYKTQIRAKCMLYLIVSSITILVSQAVASLLCFNLVNLICGTVFLLVYNYGYNCFAIYLDLSRPKLNWATHNEAVKNNRNAVLPTFINMGVFILLLVAPVVAVVIVPSLTIMLIVTWSLLMVVAVAVALLFHFLLYSHVQRFIERIEQ